MYHLCLHVFNAIGLAGSNDLENAEVASYIEAVEDIWVRLFAYFLEPDAAVQVSQENYIPIMHPTIISISTCSYAVG